MSEITARRIMLAAPRSGSGKTMLTCAFLEVLKSRDLSPLSYKVGPDYIDPMFHKKILGIDSRNLDIYFSGPDGVRKIMSECKPGYAVIEGVMGLYDGTSVDGTAGSSYEVAAATQSPIILVVDASGVGRTIISLIKGMIIDDINSLIKGIILNKTTESFYEKLKPVLEEEIMKMRQDIKILGFFPKNQDISIESRHLGLKMPDELDDIRGRIKRAASIFENNVDVDEMIAIMDSADRVKLGKESAEHILIESFIQEKKFKDNELTLAVANDDAFCFYYKDNLELFEEFGVRLSFFSPLYDKALPENIDGILLGGGYPENYLDELSRNKTMLASIRKALESGVPSLAECGGFMYLHKKIIDKNLASYEMVGSIDGECHYAGHLVRFGYMEIESKNEPEKSDILMDSLVGMKGHEFHYFESSSNGEAFMASKPDRSRKWDSMMVSGNGVWGFPHFYYRSKPEFIYEFIKRMKEVKDGKLK